MAILSSIYLLSPIHTASNPYLIIIIIIMEIFSAPSRVNPRRLQTNKTTLKTNRGGRWDDILSNVPIYTATPSITDLLHKHSEVIHGNKYTNYIHIK